MAIATARRQKSYHRDKPVVATEPVVKRGAKTVVKRGVETTDEPFLKCRNIGSGPVNS